jgi:hypothetical protein
LSQSWPIAFSRRHCETKQPVDRHTVSTSSYARYTLLRTSYQRQHSTMAEATPPKSYSSDPLLYLYTSLTSGSSHIVTATSRMETILKANRIPFRALDIATDEKARMLWGRRAGKDESGRARKIPGLVQMGLVIGVRRRPTWHRKHSS